MQRRYHYDALGNLEDSHKGSKQFFYDPLDHLIHVKGVVEEQFAKDNNPPPKRGNRLTFHGDCHYAKMALETSSISSNNMD